MDDLILALKAAGEPTRLRILLVLHRSELTVSEICRVLGQSQPRVSRHLKLLCDAGLLVRQAEGTSAYYRHARTPFADHFLTSTRSMADLTASSHLHDEQQLAQVRAGRAELAARSQSKIGLEADLLTGRQTPDQVVEAAMLAAAGDLPINRLLDIGTGTGRVLELFAPHITSGLGVELSREMLNLARTQLDAVALDHCSVRQGNAYNLEVDIGSVDLAVLHHVLHFLDEPARAIEEAAHAVGADGRLIIVDYSPHQTEALRAVHGHRRLGFADEEIIEWCRAGGLGEVSVERFDPPDGCLDGLIVNLWVALQRSDAPTLHNLEAAT